MKANDRPDLQAMMRGDVCRLIAIDPSSVRTGWAVAGERGDIIEAGAIRGVGDDPVSRVFAMAERLGGIIVRLGVTHGIIEVSSGHVQQRHGGGGAGLAIYGYSVGYIHATLDNILSTTAVIAMPENAWIKGRSKDTRKHQAKLLFPEYAKMADSKGDIADAICLASYGSNRFTLVSLAKRA